MHWKRRVGILVLFALFGLEPAGRIAAAQGSEALVMIANKGNASATGINLGEARKLLLGETSGWRSGEKVLLVLAPAGSAERAAVLKKVCGMTEAAYTRYQMQASFTGQMPAAVSSAASDAAVKAAVKTHAGAIGFIHKAEADESIRVVLALD